MKKLEPLDHFATFAFQARKEFDPHRLEKILKRALRKLSKKQRRTIIISSIVTDQCEADE